MNVNADFATSLIDVDFGAIASAEGRATGCRPRVTAPGEEWAVFESKYPTLPKDRWEELASLVPDLKEYSPYQHDQDREGSCASNCTAGCLETLFCRQIGFDKFVPLSPISLYCRVGSNPNSGSSLDSNLREARDHGILPLDTPENRRRFEHTHPHCGFHRPLPAGWQETAALFRIAEWYDVATTEGLVTALLMGFPAIYARDGHSIKPVALVKRSGVWYIKYDNSWGDWGDNGCGYDSLGKAGSGIRQYGCFVPRSIVTPDELMRRVAA